MIVSALILWIYLQIKLYNENILFHYRAPPETFEGGSQGNVLSLINVSGLLLLRLVNIRC
jgi:hypothetical protein